jgi:hypothetical protein
MSTLAGTTSKALQLLGLCKDQIIDGTRLKLPGIHQLDLVWQKKEDGAAASQVEPPGITTVRMPLKTFLENYGKFIGTAYPPQEGGVDNQVAIAMKGFFENTTTIKASQYQDWLQVTIPCSMMFYRCFGLYLPLSSESFLMPGRKAPVHVLGTRAEHQYRIRLVYPTENRKKFVVVGSPASVAHASSNSRTLQGSVDRKAMLMKLLMVMLQVPDGALLLRRSFRRKEFFRKYYDSPNERAVGEESVRRAGRFYDVNFPGLPVPLPAPGVPATPAPGTPATGAGPPAEDNVDMEGSSLLKRAFGRKKLGDIFRPLVRNPTTGAWDCSAYALQYGYSLRSGALEPVHTKMQVARRRKDGSIIETVPGFPLMKCVINSALLGGGKGTPYAARRAFDVHREVALLIIETLQALAKVTHDYSTAGGAVVPADDDFRTKLEEAKGHQNYSFSAVVLLAYRQSILNNKKSWDMVFDTFGRYKNNGTLSLKTLQSLVESGSRLAIAAAAFG